MKKDLYQCPKCSQKYDLPNLKPVGYTFWHCPFCGVEDGVHLSPPPEAILNKKELIEYKLKRNIFCIVKILYKNLKDIPKLKKYKPELKNLSNRDLIAKLSSDGGLIISNISLFEAELIKLETKALDLTVEINFMHKLNRKNKYNNKP